eukprot:TRINITY_DN51327_c0_g1_i2.p1 TRINITY_DN51327_c0_g1~~TRINITY_DN51327_c0_g1_i2.p1  ORF type:complete len:192 (+),score=9.84 TRINITY_DN51327_c0_g1_i2:79-654(+)
MRQAMETMPRKIFSASSGSSNDSLLGDIMRQSEMPDLVLFSPQIEDVPHIPVPRFVTTQRECAVATKNSLVSETLDYASDDDFEAQSTSEPEELLLHTMETATMPEPFDAAATNPTTDSSGGASPYQPSDSWKKPLSGAAASDPPTPTSTTGRAITARGHLSSSGDHNLSKNVVGSCPLCGGEGCGRHISL